jgi:uncharacterized protein (DUF1330 family)
MNKGYLIAHVTVSDPVAYADYARAAAEAKGFYESPAYQAARLLRAGAAHGTFVLVEGASL